jgi:hypothetical protein
MGLIQSKQGHSTTSPLNITLDSATTAGNGLIVVIGHTGSTNDGTVSGITLGGAAGNFASAASSGNPAADAVVTDCWLDLNCAGGQTAVSVSFTGAAGTIDFYATVYERDDLLTASAFDKSSGNPVNGSASSWTSNATATTTQAVEVWVGGVLLVGASALTPTGPSSPWNNLTALTNNNGGTQTAWLSGWEAVTATGTATYSGTVSPAASVGYTALAVTLKAVAAAAPSGPARPGRTWLRRFRHRQVLPPPPAPAAAPVTATAPLIRPAITSRAAARARTGPSGRPGGGIAGPPPAAAVTPVPPRPFISRPPAPARARTGPSGRPAAGVASAIVTPLGSPARPRPFVFRSPAPARARTGPAGTPGDGIASGVVTPLGSRPSPAPRPVIQHLPPRRAVTGPRTCGAGIASGVVTPRGTPGPAWRPQPRRPGPARGLWHGAAGPAAVIPPAAQPYQRPPAQARRPAPARAVWHGNAGPANAAPVTTTTPRPPAQPRSPAPRRAVWHGNASRVITPLGTPARRPGPVITSKPRARGLWHGNTGPPPPPPSAPPPRWRPLPSRRGPQRARTGGVRGLANAAPPVVTYGTARQGTLAIPAAQAAQSGVAHATAGTGTAAAYPPSYEPAYGTPEWHAEAGQSGTPAAQSGQMPLPRAQ